MADIEPYLEAAFYNHYDGATAGALGFSQREAFVDVFATAALACTRTYVGDFELNMENFAQKICDDLLEDGVIITEVDPLAGLYMQLDLSKFQELRQKQLSKNAVFQRVQKIGPKLLADAFKNYRATDDWSDTEGNSISVPAADRIVSLDHNQIPIQEIQDSLEVMSENLRKDNSDRIKNIDEKQRFIAQIIAAKDLFKLKNISVRSLTALVFPVLFYLADKFADGAIGTLAEQLLKLIAIQFGISI